MDKITFKFGLFLGGLIVINVINLINIFCNIVSNGGLFWVLNGCIAVILCFVHVILIDEVLSEEQ